VLGAIQSLLAGGDGIDGAALFSPDPQQAMSQAQRGFYYAGNSPSDRSPSRFMPVKLQVVKEGADEGEPADYLFEQDRITIGRGSNNDLTLPDQKVSTEHAEIRSDGGQYLLHDRESKNKTYVDGRRVGESEPYVLESGDVFRVGDFEIEFAPLFMPSSEQTAFAEADEEANPFEKDTRQLAGALEGLAETYKFAPSDQREEDFAAAVQEHLAAELGEEEAVQRVMEVLGGAGGDGSATTAPSSAADGRPSEEAVASVLDSLLEAVARMISIPNHFWREFTGDTLTHPSEKAALHGADVDELRAHLLGDDVTDEQRETRLEHLSEAVDSLVAHNMAMLAGYKKSVMAGSKELLRRLNPMDALKEAEEADGGMMGGFFGGGGKSELEKLDEQWKELFHGEWGELENEFFRPTYVDAYVDRMAQTWDIDKAELVEQSEGA
jgi:pSer/pThr/pTyr-binding forkhead associated (FHA) protein